MFAGRELAITIDDLPRGGDAQLSQEADLAMTEKLLAPFQQEGIPLIGFVNECHHTEELERILQLWVKAGADLGNHTCSHPDLNSTSVNDFQNEIVNGERITTAVLGHRPRYFRYPFLHTGRHSGTKQQIESFLTDRGYRNAPVTLDNDDYIFAHLYASALTRDDAAMSMRIREAYIHYLEAIFAFFEERAREVTGSDIRQILLIHASQLNADVMPRLLKMIRNRGYRFVTLDRALSDPAYKLPDAYVGTRGISWIHRWAESKGIPPKREPDEPDWVLRAFKAENGR